MRQYSVVCIERVSIVHNIPGNIAGPQSNYIHGHELKVRLVFRGENLNSTHQLVCRKSVKDFFETQVRQTISSKVVNEVLPQATGEKLVEYVFACFKGNSLGQWLQEVQIQETRKNTYCGMRMNSLIKT